MRFSNLLLLVVVVATAILFFKLRDLNVELNRLGQIVERLGVDQNGSSGNGGAKRIGAERIEFRGQWYDTYTVDLSRTSVKIYFKDQKGQKIESVKNLKEYLEDNSNELVFATNAGMFSGDLNAIGLLVVQGKVVSPLNLRDGDGNFYMKPNGVFAVGDKEAFIVESSELSGETKEKFTYATQSGPLLLSNGSFHPGFNKDSKNKAIRSGVGIISRSKIVFAISNDPVNFFDFAMLFKAGFACRDALYLDGVVSKMYLPSLKRFDLDGNFAGIIAVTDKPREVAQKR